MSEFNADGDVTGPYDQCMMVKEFAEMLKADEPWLSAFTFYQFRDRGRLGLEIEDPNNSEVGIEQPVMDTYRELIKKDTRAMKEAIRLMMVPPLFAGIKNKRIENNC